MKARAQGNICTLVFKATLHVPKTICNPSAHQLANGWSVHKMEYLSDLKRKEILIQATLWMNLEDIILSDISQSQWNTFCVLT